MLSEQFIVDLGVGRGGRRQPHHRRVHEQIRAAILEGRLHPGDRLPSTRDLAVKLGLARNTVGRAYDDLLAEGFLTSQVGSGTYVAPELARQTRRDGHGGGLGQGAAGSDRNLTAWGRGVVREVPDGARTEALPFDFRPGTPDWEAFPHSLWLRLLGRAVRGEAHELMRYGEPAGYYPLREAIARHLSLSRAVVASAEQVVIVGGSQQTLDILARLKVGEGDVVAMEDPGYPDARRVFAAAGAELAYIPVDGDGLVVDELLARTRERSPRLVYVTPSHQFPTGVTLSLVRRLALLEWAKRRDVLIVEDDYDSEFNHSGRPVSSLQGLDRSGHVVYLGTFSTVLFPPLRVGFVVLPPSLVLPFVKGKWLADRQTPTLEQLALADFLAEGHFARHLRRMRRLAAERRAALLGAVGEFLGGTVNPPAAGTGMHIMLRFYPGVAPGAGAPDFESAVVARAAALGVGVYPVGPCCSQPATAAAVVLGYAALAPGQIREGVRLLAQAAAEVRARK